MPEWLDRWLTSLEVLSWWEVILYSIVAALVVQWVLVVVVGSLARRTRTSLDEAALAALRRPIFVTVVVLGIHVALQGLEPLDPGHQADEAARKAYEADYASWSTWASLLTSLIVSVAVLVWMRALMRVSDAILSAFARRADDFKWIEAASLPLYEIVSKLMIVGGAVYAFMVTWRVDLTAWLASAGILGIAIGFAAKDTLANLFAGIFILADSPYKLGDYIVLETGERGRVTDIGIRSTRILTRDDIEITLPNGVMANSKIINESSGPYLKRRLRVDVGIAYGSDLVAARAAMEEALAGCDLLADEPAPTVRMRAMGDSALLFQVRGYILRPALHGRALDQVCSRVYEGLVAAGIEIPFPQRVVHMADAEGLAG